MTLLEALNLARTSTGKSVLAFVLGAAALLISAFVIVRGDIAASAHAAAALLSEEATQMRAEARELDKARKAASEASPLTSVPAFIDRIGVLAAAHGAEVASVQPVRDDDSLFQIGMDAGYRQLLSFIAALEGLDVEVAGFEFAQEEVDAGAPRLAASISIRPRNDAQRLSVPRLAAVREAIAAEAARDPFQALIAGAGEGGVDRLDLSTAYKLTGIATLQPSGDRIATIDLLDYVTGDVLDGRRIVRVDADRVLLDGGAGDGGEKYVIRFRERDSDAGAASLPERNEIPANFRAVDATRQRAQ